jgi:thiol-disulfide isomerase/thioredoxin
MFSRDRAQSVTDEPQRYGHLSRRRAILAGMQKQNECELIDSAKGLEKAIKEKDSVFVLFYASWCPFSQEFLPEFLNSAYNNTTCHIRILVDDKDDLVEKYSIDVYPTVLYFEKGKLVKRLDGIPHEGLDKTKLKEFISNCKRP